MMIINISAACAWSGECRAGGGEDGQMDGCMGKPCPPSTAGCIIGLVHLAQLHLIPSLWCLWSSLPSPTPVVQG